MKQFDFAIVGAGMAGASLAAELAEEASVLLLEAEDSPGRHATGRSAAFWEETYGGPDIVPLTIASGPYLAEHGFLQKRGALYIARETEGALLDAFEGRFADTAATFERIGHDRLWAMVPGLRAQWTSAIWVPECADIDVAGLHAHYLMLARQRGVMLATRARLEAAEQIHDGWSLTTARGERFAARMLVNAAGAWADEIANLAGARSLGIAPLRRTVVQLRVHPAPPHGQPLVLDISGQFYFKPESGKIWLSPHDEEPSAPCDAAPEELAVAEAIDRFSGVVDSTVEAVEHRWAGLRSFAPDRKPIYGFDPQLERFAWFAGQGGYGIQTAPAAARLCSQILLGKDRDAMTRNIDAGLYAPHRFS